MCLKVNGSDSLQAWKEGARLLINSNEIYNLVTTISNPTHFEENWFSNYNPAYYDKGIPSLSDVTTTIFPYKFLSKNYSREQLYERYIAVHTKSKKIHRRTKHRWGTYFDRIIEFGNSKTNQLEKVISALIRWQNNPKTSLVIHTSSIDTDTPNPQGLPCLQYVQLLCPDKDTASMLAVYRNHDFFAKAFGNFIGLGQLLTFICNETGRSPGMLVCHSAHAYRSKSKSILKQYARL